MRPSKTTTWVLIIAVAVVAVMSSACWLSHWLYFHERDDFLRSVHIGDTESAISSAVGSPDERYSKGNTLPKWAGYRSRVLPGDAWVYRVPWGNRITLMFENGRVVEIIDQPITGNDP